MCTCLSWTVFINHPLPYHKNLFLLYMVLFQSGEHPGLLTSSYKPGCWGVPLLECSMFSVSVLRWTVNAPCPSVSFTVWYDGGVLRGIWAGRQPASCRLTRSRPRSPLTDTGPGGRHSPSGWTWRDRNKEIHCYWHSDTYTVLAFYQHSNTCFRTGMEVLFIRLWKETEHLNTDWPSATFCS